MPPLLRLRRAGLTDADEPEVRARWAAMTNAERLEAARAMEYVDDEELARQVVEMREEAEGDRAAAEALAGYSEPEPPKRRRGRPRKDGA